MKDGLVTLALFMFLFTGWSASDKLLWGTYTALWFIDMGQTITIAENPDKYSEKYGAWMMGEHPSKQKVYETFAIWYGANYLIASLIGNKWRSGYIGFSIAGHAYGVGNNQALGIKASFDF